MITCRELVDALPALIAEELTAERRHQLEQHLAGCSSCTAFLDSYRKTTALTRQLPQAPLSPDLQERLRAALLAEAKKRDA